MLFLFAVDYKRGQMIVFAAKFFTTRTQRNTKTGNSILCVPLCLRGYKKRIYQPFAVHGTMPIHLLLFPCEFLTTIVSLAAHLNSKERKEKMYVEIVCFIKLNPPCHTKITRTL